ncbi:hypothetical protein XELAEV_18004277mg [Xenopus laevis]|uniref:Uncharacterized protein n=1 Tax=Xenopus laevis TaxID=8355 RepID=A0A974BRF8_XENLA|nr:hypothetical protein XELAEV_18004277mg [Xenopus laevis]
MRSQIFFIKELPCVSLALGQLDSVKYKTTWIRYSYILINFWAISIFFSKRKKSPQTDAIFGSIPVPSMAEAPPFKMDDNVYDTINEGKYRVTSDSGSTSPLYSSSRKSKLLKKEDEDFYYYAADNKGQEEPEEVEYAAIGFSQHNQPNEASQQDGHHTEHAVYAILKN